MSGCRITLKYKDMYAIKHSLQRTVAEKVQKLLDSDLIHEDIDQLTKDITHEKTLIATIEGEIERFKSANRIK